MVENLLKLVGIVVVTISYVVSEFVFHKNMPSN